MTSNLTTARINAELEPFIPLFPAADLDNPVTARKKLAELAAAAAAPDTAGMEIEDRTVPADPDVPVRIYRPHRAQGAIVWLHGGGFVMGDLDTEHPWAARVADGSGAVVVSVGYRRAPEHRFPAALDDAYAALTWTAEHAAEIGIDPERIAVGGHAAGAGLAAAVALRARDQQGPPIRYQLLNQPELDDRQETWSARTFTETPFMTRDKVAASWRHYLGPAPASPYAAPARADDLSGLPPAYIAVRVELRGGDAGRGQAGQIVGPRRGSVRRGGRRAQVVPPRCGDLVARHEGRIGEVPRRPRLLPVIELGLVEQLEADRRSLLVTCPQRHRGREPRAGGVAADRDPPRVDAELGRVLGRPGQRGVGVVQGGREPMLGGPAVAHRDHHRPGAVRDPDGPRMLGLQVTHDESAAVQPDDGALRPLRAIDPHRHVRVGGHRAVLDLHCCRCPAPARRRPARRGSRAR